MEVFEPNVLMLAWQGICERKANSRGEIFVVNRNIKMFSTNLLYTL